MAIEATQTLREAAAIHLMDMKGGGVDADADARWVWIKIGPIPFAYPNTGAQAPRAAHDLYHLLTRYRRIWSARRAGRGARHRHRDRSAVR
jgi:hypothetical protein